MMVRTFRGLAAATLLLAVVATAGQAQMASTSRFAVSGGVAMPMGDFGDAVDMGFTVGGSWAKGLTDKVDFRLNADYARFGTKGVDGTWSQLGVMANGVLKFEGGMYGLAGLGFVNQTLDIDGLGSESEGDLAWNVGAGFNVNKWFIEARYQSVMSEGTATTSLPIVFGWRF
jgi:Outer membrane protein beta-barrel domain